MKTDFPKNVLRTGSLISLISLVSFAGDKADNTRVNQRDQIRSEITADQQKMNKNDTEITQRIRKELMNDSELSTYAQNIKIITVDRSVTLKGPIRSASEGDRILKYARSVAGDSHVKDEMAIASETNN